MEQRKDAPQAIGIGGCKQEKVAGRSSQSGTEQCCYQGAWLGKRKIEAITPVTLELRHGREGLLDRGKTPADATKASKQLGGFHGGELGKRLWQKEIVFPLQKVGG
jgi:hypothetical protein